jgi:hypothetical protein
VGDEDAAEWPVLTVGEVYDARTDTGSGSLAMATSVKHAARRAITDAIDEHVPEAQGRRRRRSGRTSPTTASA